MACFYQFFPPSVKRWGNCKAYTEEDVKCEESEENKQCPGFREIRTFDVIESDALKLINIGSSKNQLKNGRMCDGE